MVSVGVARSLLNNNESWVLSLLSSICNNAMIYFNNSPYLCFLQLKQSGRLLKSLKNVVSSLTVWER
ncbi:hypothetical protein NQ314_001976 [Rhamnusium bicolor]|uniref:Uncharacterized protein n=1 Tax=Rhamnusium bicolor TaxID=1586634 RepID=A0AAV8ZQI8_9CUCU|nr:hypothetical protein NQ314_001976 [Rhamnusium bicolor]